jgi:hypothetical protein
VDSPLFYCNGIDAETGSLIVPPATPAQLAAMASGDAPEAENVADMHVWKRQGGRGLKDGDPRELSQAGWGVILAQNDKRTEAVLTALQPLLDLRKSQIGEDNEHYYQEYIGEMGYQTGDTKRSFLSRHGVGPGAADPNYMPYYLLIVGDPAAIPYEFQYQLDMQYAVGRIWFETEEEYARYAQSVVAAETAPRPRSKTAAVFAPQHPGDAATELSSGQLATPLAKWLTEKRPDWQIKPFIGEAATKECLGRLLGGAQTPDLLFTAGHGVVFRNGDPRQFSNQGALLCQDWPGHSTAPEHYFSAADLNGSTDLRSLVSFHFACYSAGGPAWDNFSLSQKKIAVAPQPFVAGLALRQLQSGALAVIGHVEKAWQCSIAWPGTGTQIQVFKEFLKRLLTGHPIGSAMEPFGVRYAELASDLSAELEEIWQGKAMNQELLVSLWTNSHDARNYIVLGDPAVRLVLPEGAP